MGGRHWTLRGPRRNSGPPASANGASSFHLFWQVPSGIEAVEVSGVLTVVEPPKVEALYFWALQASFPGGGAAHLGLQWGADPGRQDRHVNFGGYWAGGGELSGSGSALPSSFANPNTRDYGWEPGRPYRLRITRGARGWAGWVDSTLVRQLDAPDGVLGAPMVWSEVFADCDAPPVTVRWSELEMVDRSGERIRVLSAVTSYQHRRDGGCDNTSAEVEGAALVQRTSTARRHGPGTVLHLQG